MIQPRLQLARRNLRHLHRRAGSLFTTHATEFVVVNELGDGAMRTAYRAVRIFPQLEFTELHSQCVEKQQAPCEIFAGAEDELDGFHRLNRADDSRQHAKHTALGARWHKPWRRRFGIQAAVAWSIGHPENGDLAFESKDRAVHVGLAEKNTGVVHEIARRKIVRAVHDDVEIFEEFESVCAGQLRFERFDLNVWIQIRKPHTRGLTLRLADVAGAERHLALQICEVHDVEIHEAESADASRR